MTQAQSIRRVSYSSTSRPAPGNSVSGDLIKVSKTPQGHTVFFIGDVMGKGKPTQLPKKALVQNFSRLKDNPDGLREFIKSADSDVHGRMNKEMHGKMRRNFKLFNEKIRPLELGSGFATGIAGRITRRRLEVYNAGHENGYLIRGRQVIPTPRQRGLAPFGFNHKKDIEGPKSIELKPGDKLVFVTDGITDSVSKDGVFFSDKRLMQLLKKNAFRKPEELKKRIFQAAANHGKIFDDASALVIAVN
ncbi:serine/threonine-protein phosphatase [Candidatus Micrarchaeota archaeon]|nr:serine/threonine-protein phosphatase [Candidatus Micrarchaeota archaeon]